MTVNDTVTTLSLTMKKGAAPALTQNTPRMISSLIATDLANDANDVINVFTFEDDTIVLLAYAIVETETTGASNMSLGKADGAELMAAIAVGSTGYKVSASGKEYVLFAAADTLDAHFSADAAGGSIRIFALIQDAGRLDGAA